MGSKKRFGTHATTTKNNSIPKYEKFEDLPVWQQAACLYNAARDFLEKPNLPLTSRFRNQLDRAALSVSNNVAEGFERLSTAELLHFLSIARGFAGEVRSMMLVVKNRPSLKSFVRDLTRIQLLAESCAKQIVGWSGSIENSPVQGKRHSTPEVRKQREAAEKAAAFRLNFLKNLKPDHPLYNSPEARATRGEKSD